MFQVVAVSPIPAEAAKMVNPVHPTPEGLARVRKLYGYDCEMCHGATGDGKGESGARLKLTMKNFADADQMKTLTDGEIFYIIQNGRGQMPGEGARASTDDTWNMVVLIRSFAKK